MDTTTEFSSAAYWEARYRRGGTSGAGSRGHLAHYKASVLNGFIAVNDVTSMIDMGCGDGNQLALTAPPMDYVGVDVSPAALALCAARHPERRFVTPDALEAVPAADLTVSMDVLFHLTEDAAFEDGLRTLFSWSKRFVLIYASNIDLAWPSPHVRHRCFTKYVAINHPEWRLLAHLPNPWPFDPRRPNETSFADFFIYGRHEAPCVIPLPATLAP